MVWIGHMGKLNGQAWERFNKSSPQFLLFPASKQLVGKEVECSSFNLRTLVHSLTLLYQTLIHFRQTNQHA